MTPNLLTYVAPSGHVADPPVPTGLPAAAGNPVGTGGSATCPEGATYVKRLGVNDSVYVIRSCANGRVDYVGASTVNVGMIEVIGYDLFLDYTMDIPNWGVGEGTMNFFMDYSDMGDYNTDAFVGSYLRKHLCCNHPYLSSP